MIRKSFIFLDKISAKTEQNIWGQGIFSWKEFIQADKVKGLSNKRKNYYNRKLKQAREQLQLENSSYFSSCLPAKETWRLYSYFQEEACYLDLEVNSYGQIIMVGLADDYNTKIFVRGMNLDSRVIKSELDKYKLIITYNGGAFDLPKLKKQLGIKINFPHLDLKPLCLKLGLKGGLKEVEERLNLNRPQNLKGHPVDLWKVFHASKDQEWLNLLVDYNKEDTENLKAIANYCYSELSKKIYKQ